MTVIAARTALCILILAIFIVAGCGVAMRESEPGREEEVYLDPFGFGDEFSSGETDPNTQDADGVDTDNDRTGGMQEDDAGETGRILNNIQSAVYGYRIHLGVFNTREDADRMAEYARSRLDVSVHVVYEPPFYRVRAGDFRTREDATDYANYMKSIDRRFNNAYPLQSPINTP